MESFYHELVKNAIEAATQKIAQQTIVVEEASKKVQMLREIDSTSLYTCISSNAGQAEIAYNIEKARLKHEVEQLELIKEWADSYLEYIKSHREDNYDFNDFHTFFDLYTTINKYHIQRLIRGKQFECKCQFFGDMKYLDHEEHFYREGEECCVLDTPVHLTNLKTAIKTIGIIQHTDSTKLNIYSVPNKYVD